MNGRGCAKSIPPSPHGDQQAAAGLTRRAALGFGALAIPTFAWATAPRRIVSVSPVVTEILYGIGAFDRVVAVTEYCLYPPQAKALPKVGGWATPSVEKVASFRPDLVAFTAAQQPFLEAPLRNLGIRTVAAHDQTVADAFRAIDALGAATEQQKEAARLAAGTRAALEKVRQRAARLPRPGTLCIVDRTPGTLRDLYAATAGSFLAELIDLAGGRLVIGAAAGGYGKISQETVLTTNPDVILELVPASQTKAGSNPAAAWQELPEVNAVHHGRVHAIREEFVPHDSQMIARTAVLFARLLHPEVPAAEWGAA